jgi:photosystem II stability/assembly factor-like uncharacterized protein
VPKGFVPLSVTFVSPETGWVLGSATCSAPPCTSVLRTRDGGRTWKGLPAPVASTTTGDGSVSTHDVRFADLLNGFAFGNALFSTHDGGAHWKQVPVPGRVVSLEVGNGRFWAVVDACDATAGSCPTAGEVVSGAVGGDAYRRVLPLAPGVTGSVVLHGRAVFLALDRQNQQTTTPTFQASADGTAFAARPLPCADSEIPYLAAASDSRLSLVCQSEDAGAGQQPKRYFSSADAGRSWARHADPAGLVGTVVAATQGAVLVGNQRTGLEMSRDGGASWQPSLRTEQATTYVGLLSATFGEAVVGPTLQLTRDAGRTWAAVRFEQARS